MTHRFYMEIAREGLRKGVVKIELETDCEVIRSAPVIPAIKW